MGHHKGWKKLIPFVLFTAALFAVHPGRAALSDAAWQQSLRQHLDKVMDRKRGAAVLVDVVSGKLLAASSAELGARHLAAPGSTVKPFLLMALIDSGKLPADARLVCPVHLTVGGRNLDCTHPPSREALDARRALAWSCNNWFVTMAQLLDPRELRGAYERAGFSSPTGLVAGEVTGHLDEIHSQEDFELQAIGAANIEITPLELAAAYRRVALLRRDAAAAEKYTAVFQGLEDSVAFGTSRGALAQEFLPSAGKTGTAGSGVGWTHAWFAGYWPAAAPQVVVVVFLERGRGGADAAPLARDIISFYARTAQR